MNPPYPLVFSSLLLRLGVGIMVTHIVMSMAYNPIIVDWQIAIFSLTVILLGVLISMVHLGTPKRFLHAFYNPASLLTWEAILTPLLLVSLGVLAVGSYFGESVVLRVIGKGGTVVFGVMLVYVIAKVYHLKARPSWATPLVVYEFFLSAIGMGVLGYVGIMPLVGQSVNPGVIYLSWVVLIVLAAELAMTLYYLHYVRGISRAASEVLQERMSIFQYYLWIGVGLAIPFVLSALTLITNKVQGTVVVVSFFSFFAGALFWRVLFFKIAKPIKITPDIEI